MEIKKNKLVSTNKIDNSISTTQELTQVMRQLIKANNPWRQFLSGVFSGLGTIFGVTIVLTFILYILTRLSFVPVLGDIATQIVRIVQSNLTN